MAIKVNLSAAGWERAGAGLRVGLEECSRVIALGWGVGWEKGGWLVADKYKCLMEVDRA